MRRRYTYRLDYRERKERSFLRLIRRLSLFALLLMTLYLAYLLLGGRPRLTEESLKNLSLLPAKKEVVLEFSLPVKRVKLTAEQKGKKLVLYEASFKEPQSKVRFEFDAKRLGLEEGDGVLFVELDAGLFRKKSQDIKTFFDLTPPQFEVVAYTPNLTLGGTGAIKLKSQEDITPWLRVGSKTYRLEPFQKGYYLALFPVRIDEEPHSLEVFAYDPAGNYSVKVLPIRVKTPKFKEEKLYIDDEFIHRVIYPLLGQEGQGLEPREAFKKVNEAWRQENLKTLEQVGSKSEARILWEGAFLQLPKSKVLAGYGDHRHYYYKGELISESRHMGYDFASVERAVVPASNSGVVVFAKNLGIYGNTVIIDHGFGVMSLYGHLSEVWVKEGQYVKKGQAIGRTGKTGLALGDHLHFGILVQGYEVNPIGWLDENWIKNRLLSVIDKK